MPINKSRDFNLFLKIKRVFTNTLITIHLGQSFDECLQMANKEENLSFFAICSLLDALNGLRTKYHSPSKPLKLPVFRAKKASLIKQWTRYYLPLILKDPQSTLATLSLLFPDLRVERVYVMKEYT